MSSDTPSPSDPQQPDEQAADPQAQYGQPYPQQGYPQQPYPQQPYPQQPYPQQPYPGQDRPAPMEQPVSIKRAVLLMRVGAALSVLGIVLTLLTLGSIRDSVRTKLQNDNKYTASNFDTAYHVAVAVVIVVALLGAALWLWMAWANGNGKSWARIVGTVLGGLAILSFVVNLANSPTGLGITSGLISLVLAAVILFLLWRPESSQFYASRSAKQLQ